MKNENNQPKKKPGGHREINNLYKTNDNRGYQMCYTSWSAQGCPKNFKNTFEFWKHFWILKTLLNFEKKIKFFIPLYPQGTQGFIQFLLAVWLAMANMDIYIYIQRILTTEDRHEAWNIMFGTNLF